MKIGFLLDDTLDSADGVQQYVLTLGGWLQAQGHIVHYIVGETKRDDVEYVHSMTKNIKVRFNKNRMTIPLPASKSRIRTLFKEIDLDVLHVQMPYSPQFAARVISLVPTSVPVVGTFHILPFSNVERTATSLLGKLLAGSLKRINYSVAVSEPAAQFARSSFGLKPVVVPNPVNTEQFKPLEGQVRQLEPYVLFVGRLVERKGVLQLLGAYKRLLEDHPEINIALEICGTGALRSKVEHIIKRYKLNDRVTLHGFISEAKKAEMMAGAQISVFPSLGGESFGIVLIEAIAAGSEVVIGGDNPGYASVLRNPETLFDPNDQQAFAGILYKFASEADLRRNTHESQKQLLHQFSVGVVGQKIETIYRDVIAKHRTSDNNGNHEYIS